MAKVSESTMTPCEKIVTQVFPAEVDDFDHFAELVNDWPFREIGTQNDQFNFEAQIDGCARLILALHDLAGPDMWQTFAKSGLKKAQYGRILKKSFKDAIRISGESLDFMLTVDYVTRGAITAIQTRARNNGITRQNISERKKVLHHEHMVPGEELCRNLVCEGHDLERIKEILIAGSCRAIVKLDKNPIEHCERYRLDHLKETRQGVPSQLCLENGLVLHKANIKPEWHGLFRYHHAELIDELVPVSARGCELLNGYRKFVEDTILQASNSNRN